MEVSVNDRAVSTSLEDGATIDALLDNLRERGEIRRDEVIVTLDVDNHAPSAADMDAVLRTRLCDVQHVCIETDDLQGYARRILTDARSMLSVLQDAAKHLADEFRGDEHEKSNADLFNLLTALQHFLACLYHVRNTCGLAQAPLEPGGRLLADVSSSLELIQTSQEEQDWHGLAAHLELKLLPALGGFERVLQEMSDSI
ncbi:MAG: hypothetical protein ACYTFZ_00025 [Planctomycetota bacterium]